MQDAASGSSSDIPAQKQRAAQGMFVQSDKFLAFSCEAGFCAGPPCVRSLGQGLYETVSKKSTIKFRMHARGVGDERGCEKTGIRRGPALRLT